MMSYSPSNATTNTPNATAALTAPRSYPDCPPSALPLAHAAGSRNTGLMLAAAAGLVPELVWLYVALIQIPIYVLPLIAKPLVRRLSTDP